MIITVNRQGGLFPPSICDLINIKSQRIDRLLNNMDVPEIEPKEELRPFPVNFKPIQITDVSPFYDPETGELVPNVKVYSKLRIGKMEHHCYSLGKVHFISLIFSDISADSYSQRGDEPVPPGQHRRWFASDKFYDLAELGITPETEMHFRAAPLNPSAEENPETVIDGTWQPLGTPLIIKADESRKLKMKGLIMDKAKLPIYNFFITNI